MTRRILFAVAASVLSLAASSAALAMAPKYTCAVGDTAEARNDVDVYDSPVKPRTKYEDYFIKGGMQAKVLARHEDGWCNLAGVAPGGGEGWVAEDHLKSASSGSTESGPETGSEDMESEPGQPAEPGQPGQPAEPGQPGEAGGGGEAGAGGEAGGGGEAGPGGGMANEGAPAMEPEKFNCTEYGPDDQQGGGGSKDPKVKYECEPLGEGKTRCCFVKYP